MNKEDIEIRAARAQQLLDDEVLNEALTGIRKLYLDQLAQADLSRPTECVEAVAALKAYNDLYDQLQSFITSGKQAERKPFRVA